MEHKSALSQSNSIIPGMHHVARIREKLPYVIWLGLHFDIAQHQRKSGVPLQCNGMGYMIKRSSPPIRSTILPVIYAALSETT
jgi:hypothetical protein